jgi:hypothetical protein
LSERICWYNFDAERETLRGGGWGLLYRAHGWEDWEDRGAYRQVFSRVQAVSGKSGCW